MTREPPRPTAPGSDDSWESLAEDLFGIDFKKSADPSQLVPPEELPVDEALPFATPPDTTPANASISGESPDAATDRDESPDAATAPDDDSPAPDFDDDSSALAAPELLLRASETDESVPQAGSPPTHNDDSPDDDELMLEQDSDDDADDDDADDDEVSVREAAVDDDEKDEFWDALNDWDWNESDSGPRDETTSQSRPPQRRTPSRQTPRTSSPVTRSSRDESQPRTRDEFVDDTDFGMGLAGDQDHGEPAADVETGEVQSPPESRSGAAVGAGHREAEAESTPQERERRKRRRRRRSRSSGRTEPAGDADQVPAPVQSVPPDSLPAEQELDEEDEDDTEVEEAADQPKRSPRRRRRRRKPAPAEETESARPTAETVVNLVDESEIDDEADEEADEDDDEDDSSDDVPRAYRNVPTWEDAISYLLHRGQRETKGSESNRGSAGKPKGGGAKPASRRPRKRR